MQITAIKNCILKELFGVYAAYHPLTRGLIGRFNSYAEAEKAVRDAVHEGVGYE